jgi:hypothetical protein
MALLPKHLLALSPHGGKNEDDQQCECKSKQQRADRPLEEHERIAAREMHGAAKVLVHQRAKHEPITNGAGSAPTLWKNTPSTPVEQVECRAGVGENEIQPTLCYCVRPVDSRPLCPVVCLLLPSPDAPVMLR